MKTLEIELTNRGTFNEIFFGINEIRSIKTKQLFDFLARVKSHIKFENIIMRGIGDPIHHPDFKRIVKFMLNQGMHVSIFAFPQTVGQYVKIFGYANPGISYVIYHYPVRAYELWMKKMATEIPLKFKSVISHAGFSDMFILHKTGCARILSIYKKRQAILKPAGIISVLNGASPIKKEALAALELHRLMGLRESIHWEDGNIWERQCSYMRGERMFINSNGFVSHCHFLSHHNNTKIFDLRADFEASKLPLHYGRQLEWRRQKIAEASREKSANSAKHHVSPCSYCQAYFFEQEQKVCSA